MELHAIGRHVWEIPRAGGMHVPGRVFASADLLAKAQRDKALLQVANVAHLPGIVGASMAMPDIHWGYGFPIGGVAATDIERGGVISPGGVGFDIGCGVRLLASAFTLGDWRRRSDAVMGELDGTIPRGLGRGAIATRVEVNDVLREGAAAVLAAGYGEDGDLARCEESGTSAGALPGAISDRAKLRGSGQLGSLGAGNHFLEIQLVEEVHDAAVAEVFGLTAGMVCVMIHCGSRGLGHQTCTDQLEVMRGASARYRIELPDRQLAAVPVSSPEGERYLAAMASAANFAWANRHVLAHEARMAFARAFSTTIEKTGMRLVFDVAHNLAKLEEHAVGTETRRLCVHRKGATRAFGPGHSELPDDLRPVGQPVLVPGSMGTASWVLAGVENNPAFSSAAHGAGRVMSRKKAKQQQSGSGVRRALERRGIAVRPGSVALLSEEAPYAYKDVDAVADVCEEAGLARKVARLRPLGVVKG